MIHGIEQNNIHFKPGYIFFSMTFQDASLQASIKSSFLKILSVISRLASMLGPSLEIEAWRFQASVEAIFFFQNLWSIAFLAVGNAELYA